MTEKCEQGIDELAGSLFDLGWSCGDLSFCRGDQVVWQFYGVRGEQRIVVRGRNQREIWAAAHRQAVQIADHDCYR